MKIRKVLLGDPGNRNVINVDLLLSDHVQQQIERTLIEWKRDFQVGRTCRHQIFTAFRTSAIVSAATALALLAPSFKTSRTSSGCFSSSCRRAVNGSRRFCRLVNSRILHSMQPIPAVRQPWSTHAKVSMSEKTL